MVAVCPPGPAGLPTSYVSCKLWVLAGHGSDRRNPWNQYLVALKTHHRTDIVCHRWRNGGQGRGT